MQKSGCQKKGSTGLKDLDQDCGMRMVSVLLGSCRRTAFHGNSIFMKKEHRWWTWESTVRLMQRSTTFPQTEGGAQWTSQWYHPSVVAQITASFEQK
ncbi:unnamed protein product [Strongylus vulgaris]|uniref:Uncharacterized protein n=1 Tax=Strongylus vulgaris TaxID=40348 RepID=A0A3P7JSY8_STRVU|nr:unnamed protein product [Strongylus vulgaris]